MMKVHGRETTQTEDLSYRVQIAERESDDMGHTEPTQEGNMSETWFGRDAAEAWEDAAEKKDVELAGDWRTHEMESVINSVFSFLVGSKQAMIYN